MDPELITPKEIEKALDLMHQAERLNRSPLLQLEVLRQHLEREGRTASRAAIEVALGQLLAELITRELDSVRRLESFADPKPRSRRRLTVRILTWAMVSKSCRRRSRSGRR